jgi:outer membrane beta-barrel protein
MVLALLSPLLATPATAADETIGEKLRNELVIQPEVARQEIHEDAIDEEDFEVGVYAGFLAIEDFGTNPVFGLRFAYHVTEGLFMETSLGISEAGKSSVETLTNTLVLPEDERDYTYYNLLVGYNFLPGESFIGGNHAFNSQFYVVGGIGSTNFANNDEFTVTLGVGYRLLLTDWLTLHIDARDHIFETDLLGEPKTTNNLELHGGLTIFF